MTSASLEIIDGDVVDSDPEVKDASADDVEPRQEL